MIFLAERGSNPQFAHYFDALYFAVTVMTTVGLGDIHPVTLLGKALTMLYMIVGAGIFVSFTAVVSTSIMQIEAERHRSARSKSDAGPDLP
ncbi:MAG: two pore domain potassium channel family protein [Bdellovibrionales bacterium]|nr:two pore domain potassium channel family protein [Bdellovibrionales bacterium]